RVVDTRPPRRTSPAKGSARRRGEVALATPPEPRAKLVPQKLPGHEGEGPTSDVPLTSPVIAPTALRNDPESSRDRLPGVAGHFRRRTQLVLPRPERAAVHASREVELVRSHAVYVDEAPEHPNDALTAPPAGQNATHGERRRSGLRIRVADRGPRLAIRETLALRRPELARLDRERVQHRRRIHRIHRYRLRARATRAVVVAHRQFRRVGAKACIAVARRR